VRLRQGRSVTIEAQAADRLVGPPQRRGIVITALGLTQILAWGSSYYLPAVLAKPIASATGWRPIWAVGGLSIGLLVAGLVSPHVGRIIEHRGGRPVLTASAILLAAGLVGLGLAQSLAGYIGAWAIMGLGMGAGLYDPAFATLGRLYGADARRAITVLTLFGGLASTVCWPLSAFLTESLGWRGACLVYAAIQLGFSLPIYLFLLPRAPGRISQSDGAVTGREADVGLPRRSLALIILIGTALMLSAVLSTMMSVHMLTILQSRGIALGAAVALGTLVGPSQVSARFIEMLIAHRHHPIWTKVASVSFVAAGMFVLAAALPLVPVALVLYGAGIGLESIARGTLPLALFGVEGYAALMGKLALPSLIAQAAAPSVGASLLALFGSEGLLIALLAIALLNVGLVSALVRAVRR
jgi:MFS family permease